MQKMSILLLIVMISFVGCGSTPSTPKVKTTEKLKLGQVTLQLSETSRSDIKYHTQSELEKLLKEAIINKLTEKNLLSDKDTMNTLKMNVNYTRRFAGDGTPFPSDGIRYPSFSYHLEVMENKKILTKMNSKELEYSGGFSMNIKAMMGQLRDKKYETVFIEAIANRIVEDITTIEIKKYNESKNKS